MCSVRWRVVRMECKVLYAKFFFQAEDGIRDYKVTGVQTCALPIFEPPGAIRNQRLDRDVVELAGKAEQPSEDQRLARHVHARKVLARVRLGIALGDRPLERRRERGAAAQLPEQVAERPRRAALDL